MVKIIPCKNVAQAKRAFIGVNMADVKISLLEASLLTNVKMYLFA